MKKILFNDKYGLTKAVLDGRKTQTRRIVPGKLLNEYGHNKFSDKSYELISHSPFKVGEEVAVAQSYRDIYEWVNGPVPECYRFSAWLKKDMFSHKGWNNKMFVRPKDMPSLIEIANIRVERLQDISDDDCMKEGVICTNLGFTYEQPWMMYEKFWIFDSQKLAFASLIDKTCGKGTLERNPWVFVYDFKLVQR